jgi:predicted DCC family thiol-disulfide oxidoreductase YuxK
MPSTDRHARSGWTVLYDSDCGFCRWSLAMILSADRRHALRLLTSRAKRRASHKIESRAAEMR